VQPLNDRLEGKQIARLLALLVFIVAIHRAHADESGVSFWLPGTFGSFAALRGDPGWSLPLTYYHSSVNDDAGSDLLLITPTYVLPAPIMGAQATVALGTRLGRVEAASGGERDSRSGVGDLYPTLLLKTNNGVHNYMSYTMVGVPAGAYQASRLANLGTNHWSLDGGGGYTYWNDKTGREFSAVLGLTYNFRNPDTDYRNGLSSHVDWAASQTFSPHSYLGVVGYFYYQLAGDSGTDNKSKVSAIGPQAGWFFKRGEQRWSVNLKGYFEFGARNRPDGWNAWLTLAMPL